MLRSIARLLALAAVLACAPAYAARTVLTQDTVYYINCSTGSDSNPGTQAQPFLTLQGAANWAYSNLDVDGWALTFQIADGVCTKGVILNAFITGQAIYRPTTDGAIKFRGNPGNDTAVTVNTGSNYPFPFLASNGASFYVENMKLECSTPGCNALETNWFGLIFFRGIVFGSVQNAHLQSITGGYIEAWGNYSIVGGAAVHASTGQQGMILLKPHTVTVIGTPNFSSAFANASMKSNIVSMATFNGNATGQRFLGSLLSVIYNGAGVQFPGNAAGSLSGGAIYQ